MKNLWRSLIFFFVVGAIFLGPMATQVNAAEVLSFGFASAASISITADKSNFVISFPDFLSGTVSNQTTVTYDISSNNITRNTGIFNVRLSDYIPFVDFQAEFGTYAKSGGNAALIPVLGGFQTLGIIDTNLANKQNISGAGNILKGTLSVNYRARVSSSFESPAANYVRTLTITFVDT